MNKYKINIKYNITRNAASPIADHMRNILICRRLTKNIKGDRKAGNKVIHNGFTNKYQKHVFLWGGRKEIFYLTTHSTHFIYSYMEGIVLFNDFIYGYMGERERNVLFNDALNTFYLRLYGVRHMVKDHSDNEKGNPLPPHRLLLLISSKGSFICTIPQKG